MKKCPKCGKKYDDSWTVCLDCRVELSTLTGSEITETYRKIEEKKAKAEEEKNKRTQICPTQLRRFSNMLLDMIFGISLTGAVFVIIKLIKPTLQWETLGKIYDNAFLISLVELFYYATTEFVWGRSPAKFITKTKVIMRDGSRLTFKAVLIRSLCRLIPFEPLSFFGDRNPVGWHDKFSKTIVVYDKMKNEDFKAWKSVAEA